MDMSSLQRGNLLPYLGKQHIIRYPLIQYYFEANFKYQIIFLRSLLSVRQTTVVSLIMPVP